MAGKADPKPVKTGSKSKRARKAASAPETKPETTATETSPETPEAESKAEATPEPTTETETPETAPEPVVELPIRDESGDDLMVALMESLSDEVDGEVSRIPNPSGTYERLMVGKKSFAYIFPPRKSGLAVKIPKPLIEVESSLPKGHGFHRTNWGLTRTIKHRSEASKVAQSLAVAAASISATTRESAR